MALRGIRLTLRSAQRVAPSAVQGLAEALHATASAARAGELGLMEELGGWGTPHGTSVG